MAGLALPLLLAASLEAFAAQPSAREGAPEMRCTADRAWCAELSGDPVEVTHELHVFDHLPPQPTTPVTNQPLPIDDINATVALWPKVVRFEGGVLVGVIVGSSQGYSGGGASAKELRLIRVMPGVASLEAPTVLTVPLEASMSIRACFDEEDRKARRDACHDEYDFTAELSLAGGEAAGLPRLRYETKATAFPAGVSRNADSTTRPPLRPSDLRKAIEPRCTYFRTYVYGPASGRYEPDIPLPDCSDYTDPGA